LQSPTRHKNKEVLKCFSQNSGIHFLRNVAYIPYEIAEHRANRSPKRCSKPNSFSLSSEEGSANTIKVAPRNDTKTSTIFIQLYFSDFRKHHENKNTKISDVFAKIVLLDISVKFKLKL